MKILPPLAAKAWNPAGVFADVDLPGVLRGDHVVDVLDQRFGLRNVNVAVVMHHDVGRIPTKPVDVAFIQPHAEAVLHVTAHLRATKVRPAPVIGATKTVLLVKIDSAAVSAAAPEINLP